MKTWKRAELLRPALDALLASTDAPERVRGDPVELPHRYSDACDIEVAALLSAALAYGRVDLFKPRLTALLDALGPSPADTARNSTHVEFLRKARGFAYRLTDARDVARLLYGADPILREPGSLVHPLAEHYLNASTPRG